MAIKTLFKDWIVNQLAASGCNQATLAKKLTKAKDQKIHRSTICNWKLGNHLPDPIILLDLAKALELQEKEIIDMLQAYINTMQTRRA